MRLRMSGKCLVGTRGSVNHVRRYCTVWGAWATERATGAGRVGPFGEREMLLYVVES